MQGSLPSSNASDAPLGVRRIISRYRIVVSSVAHAGLFAFALFMAFGLYYNFKNFDQWLPHFFLPLVPIVVVARMIVFAWMKMFRGSWRYVGMRDVLAITKATHISTIVILAIYFTIEWVHFNSFGSNFLDASPAPGRVLIQFPQSIFIMDWGMTIAAVCGARILVRLYHEEIRPVSETGTRPCLIVGAGDTGEALLREILRMPIARYRVIGFLDDDASKIGARIHAVPVLGRTSEAYNICKREGVEEILLAMPRAAQKKLREIVEQIQGLNVRFRTIPAMEAVIEGRVKVSQIRDVDIKDLLGREQVALDTPRISEFLQGQRVLITGAGGSIGAELCRQVLRFQPARLILLEQAENNLFEIDRELARLAPEIPRICYVADICDAKRIDCIFATERPVAVFHAAAHKHVPMMEINVGEAIKNNIFGTKTVADAAKRHNVRRFVMISTDKAVNPTSVMGCSKRVAEMYIQQLRQGATTQFMTVRFGNVLGSSGSVVPIFAKQIAVGGPVTVTDPRMTRYFMTIPEATQLVLQAGVMGQDGDIFVLDMGEPVKIVDLAREMITLSGLRPGEDIEIQFTGIRPGEKLYEELSVTGENMGKTTHDKIYVWQNRKEDWPRVCRLMDQLVGSADSLSEQRLKESLIELVPEFAPETLAQPSTATSATTSPTPLLPGELRVASND